LPGIHKKSGVRKKVQKKHPKRPQKKIQICGFDISPSSIAGASVAYDSTLRKWKGPVFCMKSWAPDVHYFDRLKTLVRPEELIHEMQIEMNYIAGVDDVFIAVEEPFPVGMVKRLESQSLKQSAEFSGAFLAGAIRYGYTNLYQITWHNWASLVASDLGVTTHHTKWNYEENPFPLAPHGKGSGKWRAKEWALSEIWSDRIPDWPDLIHREKTGKIPRPEKSKARAVQPDDRYDALGIMEWMKLELKQSGTI